MSRKLDDDLHGSFMDVYTLHEDHGKYPPFIIKEARRKGDDFRVIAKILCKYGQTTDELNLIVTELNFWRQVNHPKICHILDCFDEEGFTYVLYVYPRGGDLAALIADYNRSFPEGFAKNVARCQLESLVFLHANGIVHGACLPTNVVFLQSNNISGWVNSIKLTFLHIDNHRKSTMFTDLQDVAYTLCSVMRRQNVVLPRATFHPNIVSGRAWNHLTDEFIDFINELWSAEINSKSAECYLRHPWLTRRIKSYSFAHNTVINHSHPNSNFNNNSSIEGVSLNNHIHAGGSANLGGYNGELDSAKASSINDKKENTPFNVDISGKHLNLSEVSNIKATVAGWLQVKSPKRDSYGRRKWVRLYAALIDKIIVLFLNENSAQTFSRWSSSEKYHFLSREKSSNQVNLAHAAILLYGKKLSDRSTSRHSETLEILDSTTCEIALWLRFYSVDDYNLWKSACIAVTDPTYDAASQSSVRSFVPLYSGDSSTPPTHMDQAQRVDRKYLTHALQKLIENLSDYQSDSFQNLSLDVFEGDLPRLLVDAIDVLSERQTELIQAQSFKYERITKEKNSFSNKLSAQAFCPLPSEHKLRVHPALHWENRIYELTLVLSTGVALNNSCADMTERWFIIDASWYRQWVQFVMSTRRMCPPGPINNYWMLSPRTNSPFLQLIEDSFEIDLRRNDRSFTNASVDKGGDFRRLTPQIWYLFEKWYGGGPAISVDGGNIHRVDKWQVHGINGSVLPMEDVNKELNIPSTYVSSSISNPDLLPNNKEGGNSYRPYAPSSAHMDSVVHDQASRITFTANDKEIHSSEYTALNMENIDKEEVKSAASSDRPVNTTPPILESHDEIIEARLNDDVTINAIEFDDKISSVLSHSETCTSTLTEIDKCINDDQSQWPAEPEIKGSFTQPSDAPRAGADPDVSVNLSIPPFTPSPLKPSSLTKNHSNEIDFESSMDVHMDPFECDHFLREDSPAATEMISSADVKASEHYFEITAKEQTLFTANDIITANGKVYETVNNPFEEDMDDRPQTFTVIENTVITRQEAAIGDVPKSAEETPKEHVDKLILSAPNSTARSEVSPSTSASIATSSSTPMPNDAIVVRSPPPSSLSSPLQKIEKKPIDENTDYFPFNMENVISPLSAFDQSSPNPFEDPFFLTYAESNDSTSLITNPCLTPSSAFIDASSFESPISRGVRYFDTTEINHIDSHRLLPSREEEKEDEQGKEAKDTGNRETISPLKSEREIEYIYEGDIHNPSSAVTAADSPSNLVNDTFLTAASPGLSSSYSTIQDSYSDIDISKRITPIVSNSADGKEGCRYDTPENEIIDQIVTRKPFVSINGDNNASIDNCIEEDTWKRIRQPNFAVHEEGKEKEEEEDKEEADISINDEKDHLNRSSTSADGKKSDRESLSAQVLQSKANEIIIDETVEESDGSESNELFQSLEESIHSISGILPRKHDSRENIEECTLLGYEGTLEKEHLFSSYVDNGHIQVNNNSNSTERVVFISDESENSSDSESYPGSDPDSISEFYSDCSDAQSENLQSSCYENETACEFKDADSSIGEIYGTAEDGEEEDDAFFEVENIMFQRPTGAYTSLEKPLSALSPLGVIASHSMANRDRQPEKSQSSSLISDAMRVNIDIEDDLDSYFGSPAHGKQLKGQESRQAPSFKRSFKPLSIIPAKSSSVAIENNDSLNSAINKPKMIESDANKNYNISSFIWKYDKKSKVQPVQGSLSSVKLSPNRP